MKNYSENRKSVKQAADSTINKTLTAKLNQFFETGEEEPYQDVYNKSKDRYERLAYSLVKDRDTAKDICQEAFMMIYQKGHSDYRIANFRTWMSQVIRRTCWANIKASANRAMHETSAATSAPTQEIADFSLTANRILEALSDLNAKNSTVILKGLLGDFSSKEVAKQLNIPKANVRERVYRWRKIAKKHLLEKGLIEIEDGKIKSI